MRNAGEDDEGIRGLVECLPVRRDTGGAAVSPVGDISRPPRRESYEEKFQEEDQTIRSTRDWTDEIATALSFALEVFEYDGLKDIPGTDLFSKSEDAVLDEIMLRDRICRKIATMNSSQGRYDSQIAKEEQNCGLLIEMGECDAESRGPVGPFTVCGNQSFSSLRTNLSVPRQGKWMYEVQLLTSGIMQIGWVTPLTVYTSEDGVGDSRDSFAYDGKRKRKWNVSSIEYGEVWAAGDIISCGIDFDRGIVEYWRNGVHLGVAYSSITLTKEDPQQIPYFPGISVSYGEMCVINFGNIPFRYPVMGYVPVLEGHDAEARSMLDRAKYLMDSLERLIIIGEAKNRASSPRAAAAMAAVHAVEYFGLDEEDDAQMQAVNKAQNARATVFTEAQEYAAKILFDVLGSVLENDYIIDSLFVESCRRMKSYDHTGSALTRYLEIVATCLPKEICSTLVCSICTSCGKRVKGNIWTREDDPESCDAIVYSMIWYHVMRNETLASYWVMQSSWMQDFEDFFFVRQPTHDDMEELIPTSLNDDIEHVLDKIIGVQTGDDSDSGLLDVVTEIVWFLNRIDDMHSILLQQLIEIKFDNVDDDAQEHLSDFRTALDSSQVEDFLDAFEANQVTNAPREMWADDVMRVLKFDESDDFKEIPKYLRQFTRYILRKNIYANKEVTPPGLSHPSVLCSLLSFMVRASRKYLRKVHLEGSGFEYPLEVFLRGIRSALFGVTGDLDDDNLAPDERIGGGLSFLCKGSVVEVCTRSKTKLHIPNLPNHVKDRDWSIPMDMRPATVFTDDAPSWSWWILDSCFTLFHVGAGQVIKKISTFMQTFEAAMSSFKTMIEKFSKEDVDPDFVALSLRECKKTMMHSLRMLMWHLNWLMPKWKQHTFGALASTMSRILLEVQKDTNAPELSYVAGFYVENILEMVLACRGPEVSWPTFEDNVKFHFEPVLELCIKLTRDPRVLHPRVQNSVLYSLWVMLRDEDTCSFIVQSEFARLNLLPCLIDSFNHPRNWIHASNAFGLLVQSSGLAPRIGSEEDSEDLKMYRATIRSWLADILKGDEKLSTSMFSSLIDRLNWISPELIVIIQDLHHQTCGPRPHEDYNLNHRRALAACDLLYHLLRLLELTCASDPDAVLSSEPRAEMVSTRLIEHIAWGLRNFSGKSHIYKLTDEIHEQNRRGTVRLGRDVRPTMVAEILGPYIGVLLSLYMHKRDESTRSDESNDCPRHSNEFMSFLEQLHGSGAVTESLIQECVTLITTPALSGLQHPTDVEMEYIYNIIYLLASVSRKASLAGGPDAFSEESSVPEEFLDPILNVLMKDPVILPDSKVTLDRKTIQRHLSVSATDPFSRCQLKEEDLIPNKDLKKKVDEWLTLHAPGKS